MGPNQNHLMMMMMMTSIHTYLQMSLALLTLCSAELARQKRLLERNFILNYYENANTHNRNRVQNALSRTRSWQESSPPKKRMKRWDRARARKCVLDDYLGPNPRFSDKEFSRILRERC